MLDFSQFSGLVLFMFIFTAGFWLLIFLLTFVVPYWLGGTIWENIKLKRERSEEHTSELQSLAYLVCRLLLEKKNTKYQAYFCTC